MKDNTWIELLEFIKSNRWEYPFEIKRDTELVRDLKINGDDASAFMKAFCEKFNVSYKKFIFDNYFEPEGDSILPKILNFIQRKKAPSKKNMTVGDLEEAIKNREIE